MKKMETCLPNVLKFKKITNDHNVNKNQENQVFYDKLNTEDVKSCFKKQISALNLNIKLLKILLKDLTKCCHINYQSLP
jgi:hypothetical protein